jgi:pilus assembly protein CpaC
MVGRYVSPGTVLLAGIAVSLAGACTAPKPKVDKKLERAAENKRAAESVDQGIEKELLPPGSAAKAPQKPGQTLRAGESIWIQSGKSRVLNLPYSVQRVSIGNPDLAGVVVLGPRSVLINAKEITAEDQPTGGGRGGTRFGVLSPRTFTSPPTIQETTVILWDSANRTDSHTVYVTKFLAEQVLLEVTIAELNRTKLEARGVDFNKISGSIRAGYWLGGGEDLGITQFFPGLDELGNGRHLPVFPLAVGNERPTFAFQSGDGDVTALVTMLETNGLATILAQPKLLAVSGQNAAFQVGGEIPIRIVTSFSAEVEFKAFGTLVNFLPFIADDGDLILTVTPEVSQPDFNNRVEGIPTFRTRRASTTAKLRDGETLVIGGLTQQQRLETERGIPYLKDIPYVGQLFRDTSYEDNVEELMVIVRPRLAKGFTDGDLPLPSDRAPLQREDVKTAPTDAPVTRPRLPVPGAP